MLPTARRYRCSRLALALPLALSMAACGGSNEDSSGAVPEFMGLAGGTSAAPVSTPVGGAASGNATDSQSPAHPAEPGTDTPGSVPLDMSSSPARMQPETGTSTTPPSSASNMDSSSMGTPTAAAPPAGAESSAAEEGPASSEMPPTSEPAAARPAGGTTNLFSELLGISEADVLDKVQLASDRIFGIGTDEPPTPTANSGYRLYYELPQNHEQAFIWAADSNDIRSEGMSYGMMIAVQMDLHAQFDRLWNFARAYMQFPADSDLGAWRYYFRWQGSVNTANASNWQVNYGAQTGPAPDGDEYLAAALYLADRRWGSDGAIDYRREADDIAGALLHDTAAGGRTPSIDGNSNMVVFYPQGDSAGFSDPSYHLPAFYEIFAQDGPASDSARWRQVAETSRQYFVRSANAATGLHPDYANFDGTPNAGGADHDRYSFDAWRVIMNMAIDHAWGSQDQRLRTQIEKYHAFFASQLTGNNVRNSLFALNGDAPSGGGSSALTATLATGSLVSQMANRAAFVQNLWKAPQQAGTYRYYQETVYMLGLLSVAGRFAYAFDAAR